MAATLAVVTGLVVTAAPASAAAICSQYGTETSGNYVIMNNRWGTTATQCINTTGSGFTITQQDGVGNTSGAPVSYPAIYLGCHYTKCSPNSPLPKQISTIGSIPSNISYSYGGSGTYDAAYDIWMDPVAKTDGVNRTEIMIWFNRVGPIQPIGSQKTTATIGGRTWAVWTGNNGGNDVISYLAPSAITSWDFDVMDFVRDTISRNMAQTSWYLTSIQAGFEPWQGGTGLAVTNFSADVRSGTTPQNPTTPPPAQFTTPAAPVTTVPNNQPGGCAAAYRVTSNWSGGFQSEVVVTNTGTSTLRGWKVNLGLPSGASINSLWSGVNSGTSGAVTVTNAPYNGALGAGQSAAFGFVGSGSGSAVTASCSAT